MNLPRARGRQGKPGRISIMLPRGTEMGVRLMVGLRTLTPSVEVRILYPQPGSARLYYVDIKPARPVWAALQHRRIG